MSGYTSLTIVASKVCNGTIDNLRDDLRSLTLVYDTNLEKIILPNSLLRLSIVVGPPRNQIETRIPDNLLENLPNNLKILVLNGNFNQRLVNLPNNLRDLILDYKFNQPLENLPESLRYLCLHGAFNQSLDNFPDKLQTLMLGNAFNQKINKLPKGLRNLTLRNSFDLKLENLPYGLRYLTISNSKLENLPSSLRELNVLSTPVNGINLNICRALPELHRLVIDIDLESLVPIIFDVSICVTVDIEEGSARECKITKDIYQNYGKDEWKKNFCKTLV